MKKLLILFLLITTPVWAADTKLSDLTELATTPAASDEFYVNDGGTGKRIQYSNVMSGNATTATALASNPAAATAGTCITNIAANGTVEAEVDVWTESENTSAGYTSTADEVGTLTTGDMCTNDGSSVQCTVNTEAELETAMDALDIMTVTADDFTSANFATACSDEDGSGDCGSGKVCMGDHTHSSYAPADSPTFTTSFTATGLVGDEDLQSEDFGEFTCAGEDACTIDDSVAVTSWNLTTPTITTSLTTDSKTISEAEIGRLDGLTSAIIDDDKIDAFSELDTIVTDKALVNQADGAVWLSAHDFGGAGSFEIVNTGDILLIGDTKIDATGESAFATTDNSLKVFDSAAIRSFHTTKPILQIAIDGGGSAITADADVAKGCRRIPNNSIITAWYIYADQSGSIVVDMWKDTFANHPPTAADSITTGEEPTLSGADSNSDTSLGTMTTDWDQGDVVCWEVESVATVEWVSIDFIGYND